MLFRCSGFCAMMQTIAADPRSRTYTGKNEVAQQLVDGPFNEGDLL
jgi:hypothetical protein